MRAAAELSYDGQEIQPDGDGRFVTSLGHTSFQFAATDQVADPGREVRVEAAPSEVALRYSGGTVVVPSPRLR